MKSNAIPAWRRIDEGVVEWSRLVCRKPATVVAITDVASRELRNNTRALLDRVGAGEEITITVDGRPVALLQPLARRPRWLPRDEFARRVLVHQADAGLATELASLAPQTTDDL